MTLQREGYVVAEAANGAEALLVTRMTRPELILLDWNMPVLNGADFAAAYRQEPGAHAPIVLMTAATRPEHRAAELGAADFLTKPFLIASLVEMVARFVSAGSPPRGVESGARA
jgi:CheY-like chemotaxis protein